MPTPADAPSFAADAMLARLARWLRVLGWDTTLQPELHDTELVRRANAEGRILLTRDRALLRDLRPERSIHLRDDSPLAQLTQAVGELQLPAPRELFTRCTVCNTPLSPPLQEPQRSAALPPELKALPGPVRHCPGCGRLYWRGSHARRMREALDRSLPNWLDREVF